MPEPKKIAFVVHKESDPSSRHRILPLYQEMCARGHKCLYLPVPSGAIGRLRLYLKIAGSDIVILHRKLLKPFEIAILSRICRNILYDFDDAVMYAEKRCSRPGDKSLRKFRKVVASADAVVAGNSFLAEEARKAGKEPVILSTPVDTAKYSPGDKKAEEVKIGWIGMEGNLFYLKALAPVFQNLARKFSYVSLSVVCSDFPDIEGIKINKRIWSTENELEFLREMDIGLMPLTDDIWSRGKCGFKILQYFSVGVPAVASPVGINCEIIKDGVNGFLAGNPDEWEARLAELIADASLRKKMGAEGRKTVAERYSREGYLKEYISLIEEIVTASS
ncbi:MAG: glycosyltransferase family 4 protein [Nitrospirota bacterium]